MKDKRSGPTLGPWDVAALVLAGLLYLAVLIVLILVLRGVGMLTTALEAGVFTGVLLLLGMGLYGFAKGRGIGKLARRILKNVNEGSENARHPIRISIGGTAVRYGEPVESAIERADRALYEVKKTTKNRFQLQ